ncbi:hypothetical protein RND71_017873 [Anisodus tanguticus]|uniref:Ty3-gypsy retrotransposon protein n=1 Tax=Anisodus tanguticus TaxID=243964 RepID=A0AAE1VBI8_9SOLA|nr:hypothetical protein RND71_017873 [Anisodus tanguticus]
MISSSPMLKEANNIVEAVKRTLAQLNLPQELYCKSNNPFMQKDGDVINVGYTLIAYQDTLWSKLYSNGDPYHSLSSMMVVQEMLIVTSIIEERLASLTKTVEGLTKIVQEQDAKISKMTNKMEGITERESSQTPIKFPEIQEKGEPPKANNNDQRYSRRSDSY